MTEHPSALLESLYNSRMGVSSVSYHSGLDETAGFRSVNRVEKTAEILDARPSIGEVEGLCPGAATWPASIVLRRKQRPRQLQEPIICKKRDRLYVNCRRSFRPPSATIIGNQYHAERTIHKDQLLNAEFT
jgi:hypothetical protein